MKQDVAIAIAVLCTTVGAVFTGHMSREIAGPFLIVSGMLAAILWYGSELYESDSETEELTEWDTEYES